MVEMNVYTGTACSKVLITGGYLIIKPGNEGIVLATTARMQCTITETNSDYCQVSSP